MLLSFLRSQIQVYELITDLYNADITVNILFRDNIRENAINILFHFYYFLRVDIYSANSLYLYFITKLGLLLSYRNRLFEFNTIINL